MPEIAVLNQTLINQIAAGEVIVRPASVVKELVENAFDAGARHIRVDMSKDGRSITVRDDGCGMDEGNAKRAILRHSTSKIRSFEDLEKLKTRGFRGEALASIMAVSRFEMITRPAESAHGWKLQASGGRVETFEPVGAPEGTTFHIRDLFYNTPARLKFLKNPGAECNAAVEILTQQALSHREVGIACYRDGEPRFDLPPDQDLRQRIESLLGSTVHGQLISVDFERDGLTVRGYACKPEASRKDRKWQYLQVNGRPISAKQLAYPIQEAYQGLLMKQRFPIVVLDIGIHPEEVDVNVHPTKEEVRFEEERKVGGLLYRAISDALHGQNLMPVLDADANAKEEQAPPAPAGGFDAWKEARQNLGMDKPAAAPRPSPRPSAGQDLFSLNDFIKPGASAAPPPVRRNDTASTSRQDALPMGEVEERLALEDGAPPHPIGQIAQTYIVAEWGEDLLLIDQHAAHERLNYMRLKEKEGKNRPSIQNLLIPIEFDVATAEIEALEAILPLLRDMGIAIEKRDGTHFEVTALPSDFDDLDVEKIVHEVMEEVEQHRSKPMGVEALRDKVLITTACHMSIRAGQTLDQQSMEALIADMIASRCSYTCPHGRPTMVLMRKDYLDHQFGRKVS